MIQTEVLIVGAGPTGLSLAAQLIRYGIDFVIIDSKKGVTEFSKALAVHARTLEIYDQLGLAQEAVRRGAIVNHVAMMHEGKILADLDFSTIGENLSPFPFVLTLEQSKNEDLLYEFIKHNGRDVRWQTELAQLAQTEAAVTATVRSAGGTEEIIEAKYAVGCDGAKSPTRRFLNLDFEGSTDARLFYVADVEMQAELSHETLHLVFGADSFALFFPMQGDDHWRLIGNLPEFEENTNEDFKYEQIEAKVKNLAQFDLDITSVKWFSTYKVHTRHVAKFSEGRVFLAGDAAHIHTPAGGQGMNTGIQDAYNLAWKIAYVLRLNAATSLLETYNEERLENAVRLLRTTDEAFEFGAGEEWYYRFFREKLLPGLARVLLKFKTAKQFIFPLISQIGISYDKDVLSRHHPAEMFRVKAGNRFPYFTIAGGASIYDFLSTAKCHFLIFNDGTSDLNGIAAEITAKYQTLIDVKIIPLYPNLADLFGSPRTFSVFVRPDGHIGFITSENPLEKLELYLSENLEVI